MASIMCCTCIFATFYSSKEPSVYGAECTFNTIPALQMATLIRCSLSVILQPLVSFVYDAASKFHPDQRLPVLHRVIAIVGIDRRTLQEVGFLQRCLEMFDVALIGSRCLLGQNQTILVSCRMTLVAEVELSHLLAPPSLSVHIGHDNFLEHGFFRGPPHLSRDNPLSSHTPSGHGDDGEYP